MEVMQLVMIPWGGIVVVIGGVSSINLIISKEWDLMRFGYHPSVPISRDHSDGARHTM
jgi:hypothetical protein